MDHYEHMFIMHDRQEESGFTQLVTCVGKRGGLTSEPNPVRYQGQQRPGGPRRPPDRYGLVRSESEWNRRQGECGCLLFGSSLRVGRHAHSCNIGFGEMNTVSTRSLLSRGCGSSRSCFAAYRSRMRHRMLPSPGRLLWPSSDWRWIGSAYGRGSGASFGWPWGSRCPVPCSSASPALTGRSARTGR